MAPSEQCSYHTSLADSLKNTYVTSYHDFMFRKPVTLQNDFPDGYTGYRPSIQHEIIHRNTTFENTYGHTRSSSQPPLQGNFRFPDFTKNKQGVPLYTKNCKKGNDFYDLCTNIGGKWSEKEKVATYLHSPWGLFDITYKKLDRNTVAKRPSSLNRK
jgi:hypothetical protein